MHRTPCWRPALHGGLWRLPHSLATLGGKERVLFTFDDGPTASTAEVAHILQEEGARGIFCLVGGALPQDPATPLSPQEEIALRVTRDLARAGHLLAVHGLSHARLGLHLPRQVGRDLSQAATRLELATGLRPVFQRPPYGHWAPWLTGSSRRVGLEPLFWSLNPFDYRSASTQAIHHTVLALARAGDIVLLHCSGPGEGRTRAVLPGMLKALRGRGLEALDPFALLETQHA